MTTPSQSDGMRPDLPDLNAEEAKIVPTGAAKRIAKKAAVELGKLAWETVKGGGTPPVGQLVGLIWRARSIVKEAKEEALTVLKIDFLKKRDSWGKTLLNKLKSLGFNASNETAYHADVEDYLGTKTAEVDTPEIIELKLAVATLEAQEATLTAAAEEAQANPPASDAEGLGRLEAVIGQTTAPLETIGAESPVVAQGRDDVRDAVAATVPDAVDPRLAERQAYIEQVHAPYLATLSALTTPTPSEAVTAAPGTITRDQFRQRMSQFLTTYGQYYALMRQSSPSGGEGFASEPTVQVQGNSVYWVHRVAPKTKSADPTGENPYITNVILIGAPGDGGEEKQGLSVEWSQNLDPGNGEQFRLYNWAGGNTGLAFDERDHFAEYLPANQILIRETMTKLDLIEARMRAEIDRRKQA